jgi:hypothetical protein
MNTDNFLMSFFYGITKICPYTENKYWFGNGTLPQNIKYKQYYFHLPADNPNKQDGSEHHG